MHRFFLFAIPLLLGAESLKLSLPEARAIALKGHPAIAAQQLLTQASSETQKQLRSTLGPQFAASFTGAAADEFSRLVFTGVSSPALFSRVGGGLQLSQLIYDFGRVKENIAAAKLRAKSQQEGIHSASLQVVQAVDQAYFGVLRAKVQERLASAALAMRRRKTSPLAEASEATVDLHEAEFQFAKAENESRAAEARLIDALGLEGEAELELQDVQTGEGLPPNVEQSIQAAVQLRPELKQLSLELEASVHLQQVEKRANRPTITALAVGGLIPATTFPTFNHYGSASISIGIPVWNGRLFDSRQTEAGLRTRAMEKLKAERQHQIVRELRIAYLNAKTAFARLKVTKESAILARKKWEQTADTGQREAAEYGRMAAEAEDLTAQYDYLSLCSALHWQLGEGQL
jgi:outer membrane protein